MNRFPSLIDVPANLSVPVFFILLLILGGCQEHPISSLDGEQPAVTNGQSGSTAALAAKCDLVVPDDEATIQTGVNTAGDGETICVEPGTYEETVEIATKNVTLHGRTAPHSGNPAILDGSFSVGSSGVTVRRFRITSSEVVTNDPFPHPFGVRVTNSNVRIENNVIEGFQADLSDKSSEDDSFSIHGVQVFGAGDPDVSNVTIRNNVIRGFQSEGDPDNWPRHGGIAGVKIQADVNGATITGNQITDHHSAGWVWGIVLTTSENAEGVPQNVTVEENHIDGLNDGSVYDVFDGRDQGRGAAPFPGSAVGIDGDALASGTTVRGNNLLAPNGAENKDEENELVAECNWWGSRSGPTADDNSGGKGTWVLEHSNTDKTDIRYTPWLNAPAPSQACIGGKTPRTGSPGNGPKGPLRR